VNSTNNNSQLSNKDVALSVQYDYYEVEMRHIYMTVSKPQNDSHFLMLQSKGKKFLERSKAFCEIGFSAGLTLRLALKNFDKVYGFDISPRNVEFTRKELKDEGFSNFELYTSDLMVFDQRFENMFDIISFIHGLEHFSEKDYPVIMNNIKKYLKPMGIFTGALPFKNQFNFRMCPVCEHVFEIDGHISSHNINTIRKVFSDNGFQIIHLDNFNLSYAISYGPLLKRAYRFFVYYLLKHRANTQIEFIVQAS
jgi:cyclopropane fatty-acyl-phospholipid synthase-like methyltransferase